MGQCWETHADLMYVNAGPVLMLSLKISLQISVEMNGAALVTGIYKYDDGNLKLLKYLLQDVNGLSSVLRSKFGFQLVEKLREEVTKDDFKRKLDTGTFW